MSTHGFLLKFVVKPGLREEFVALMQPLMAQVETEPGTLLYLLHCSSDDPNVLWLYERYVDEAALQLHQGSAVHTQVIASLVDRVKPETEMYSLDLLEGKGLPLVGV